MLFKFFRRWLDSGKDDSRTERLLKLSNNEELDEKSDAAVDPGWAS